MGKGFTKYSNFIYIFDIDKYNIECYNAVKGQRKSKLNKEATSNGYLRQNRSFYMSAYKGR